MDRRNRPSTLPPTFDEYEMKTAQSLELTGARLPTGGKTVTLPTRQNIKSLEGEWRARTKMWARVNSSNSVYVAVETV